MRVASTSIVSLLAACLVSAAGAQSGAGTGTRSMRDGVYTVAQAQRGAAAYARACAECHGANLKNDDGAAPLAGSTFIDVWKPYSAADLFERMRKTMPTPAPGSLSAREYVDILAQILQVNGYPAGNTELEGRAEFLKQIRFE